MNLQYFPMDRQLCTVEIESCECIEIFIIPNYLECNVMKMTQLRGLEKFYVCKLIVGYTMSDLRYRWAKGLESVGISSDVSLPQFKVNGHRQQAVEISLSSGKDINI